LRTEFAGFEVKGLANTKERYRDARNKVETVTFILKDNSDEPERQVLKE